MGTAIRNPMSAPIREARKGQLLRQLQTHRERPIAAIELAKHLGIDGNHETRRRAVRMLIGLLHRDGYAICADCHPTGGGYWLARDDAEWHRYKEARKLGHRCDFVKIRRMAEAARDRCTGQQEMAFV